MKKTDNTRIRDAVLEAFELGLGAQLYAIRRLRKGPTKREKPEGGKGMSQTDMAYDILKKTGGALHISDLLSRIRAVFGVKVDRESLVSALSKKVARKDRFVRTGKNTFALRSES